MNTMYKVVDGVAVKLTPEDLEQIRVDALAYRTEQGKEHSLELLEYMQEFRDMRRELLNVLTGIAIAEDVIPEFKTLRDALRNIPEVPSVANATTAAEAKAAIKHEYARIVSTAPPAFVTAFKELNG